MIITTGSLEQLTGTTIKDFPLEKRSVEASSLGLRPGQWPLVIQLEFGEGDFKGFSPFFRDEVLEDGGYVYRNGTCVLLVEND